MLRSDTAVRLDFKEQFNPPQEIVENLELLCENVLEPLRMILNKPILISSGYRCPRLNAAVGGAHNSQHTVGEAADIQAEGMTTEELYLKIKTMGIISFDQLIQEFAKSKTGGWIHISYKEPPRNICLIAEKINGQTVYTPDNKALVAHS